MSAESSKVAVPKAKQPAKPMEHPPVAEMVKSAITSLADKKGSSLAAIKKYIDSHYKGIDMVKLAPFIRRFLKKAVTDGVLVTAKGHAGSFKLGEKVKKAPKVEKKPKKVKTPKKAEKPKAKKETKAKKDAKPKAKKETKAKKDAKPKAKKTPKKEAKPKTKKMTPKKVAKKTTAAKTTKPKAAKKPAASKTTKPKKPAAKTTKE